MGTIHVSGLGKAYRQYPSRWARLAEWMLPRSQARHHLHWVIRDVTFRVEPGEAVGIIGVNGAGKSTLLKIITGTTQPTTGRVHMAGRVAALLELGMGFHPDFTGRQNAVMACQLLGIGAGEIEELMPQIESFAEIGDYMDQPVRVYSSGMQMRLAFSVAVARRPDILIVDEALSVGDAFFQHKCFERIRQFGKQGTTLLIVSHDKQAIQSICSRAILLDGGRIAFEGEPEAVMDYYNALLSEARNAGIRQDKLEDGKTRTVSGTGEAVVTQVRLLDAGGAPVAVAEVGQPVRLSIDVEVHAGIDRLVLGYGIKDRLGHVMYGTNTDLKSQVIEGAKAGDRYNFEIAFPANFGPGAYSVQTALVSSDTHLVNNYEWRDRVLMFEVVSARRPDFVGCIWMDPLITITPQAMRAGAAAGVSTLSSES